MLLVHLAIAFILKWIFLELNLPLFLIGSTVSGIDIIAPALGVRGKTYHCRGFYHSIFLPLTVGLVLLLIGFTYSLSFMIGGFAHLLLDSLDEQGRPWFYPLDRRMIGINLIPFEFKKYLANPACKVSEVISVFVIVAFVAFREVDLGSIAWLIFVSAGLVLVWAHENGNNKLTKATKHIRTSVKRRRHLFTLLRYIFP